MSHKTIYIDVDEEITSIVDRVRKSHVDEIIVVVPKQALLIQSLVNLKLFKKEADRRRKKVMIVTQDRLGKKLIEKAGILVQGKTNGNMLPEVEERVPRQRSKREDMDAGIIENIQTEEDKIGSSSFYDESTEKKAEAAEENIGKAVYADSMANSADESKNKKGKTGFAEVPDEKKTIDPQIRMSDIVAGTKPKIKKEKKRKAPIESDMEERTFSAPKTNFQERETERQKKITAEKFFQAGFSTARPMAGRHKEKILKTAKIKGKAGKYFFFFSLAFAFFLIMAILYFYLPRATVALELNQLVKSASLEVEANAGVNEADPNQSKVPATVEKISIEKSGEFKASGKKNGAGKATGRVVIYNEFSSEDQPLVATTRFVTDDGKVFRITKNIVVPGLTKIGEENKPGAIEADVTADQPGAQYNIESSTFKIPGFAGGPKYEKFYAKSTKSMTGGTEGETSVVTAQDIANAKEGLSAQAKQDALQKLKESLGADRRFFEDMVRVDMIDSSSTNSIGAEVENFTYNVKVEVKATTYSEEDVKNLILVAEGKSENSYSFASFDQNLNYLLSSSEPDGSSLKFQVKADLKLLPAMDVENFKKGIQGKNSQEIVEFVKNYPAIKNVEVKFSPFFVSRAPMNEARISVIVK